MKTFDREISDLYFLNMMDAGCSREEIKQELKDKYDLTEAQAESYWKTRLRIQLVKAKAKKLSELAERNVMLLESMLSEALLDKDFEKIMRVLEMENKICGAYSSNIKLGTDEDAGPIKITFGS